MNLELIFVSGTEKNIAFVTTDKINVEAAIRSSVNLVDSMDTEDIEAAVTMLNKETDPNAEIPVMTEVAELCEQGLFEQAINNATWLSIGSEDKIPKKFEDDLVDKWSIEIDLNDEFVRYYNFDKFVGALDFLALDEMNNEAVTKKIDEILTGGVAVSKLTISTCTSVQSSMKQQERVLKQLFECINEGREHPRFFEGITEEQVAFAEKYCQDMINAANTLSAIAKNAEKILRPLEDGRKKAIKKSAAAPKKRAPRKKKETKKTEIKTEAKANGAA